MHTVDLAHIDQEVRQLLKKTGVFIKKEFQTFSYSDVAYKGQNDPFTYVDVSVEERLRDVCGVLIPGSGFVNEESDNQRGENDYTWIIDPIDGTSNFTHGIPHFAISLALQYKEELVLGYVYAPIFDQMFAAIRGQGATLNGVSIHVSNRKVLKQGLMAVGFPYASPAWREKYLKVVTDIMDLAHGVRRMGSASLDLAYVAAGRLDGYFETNLSAWDVAAGALLVKEAGGTVTDYKGEDNYLFGGQILATNGHIHQEVLQPIVSRMFANP